MYYAFTQVYAYRDIFSVLMWFHFLQGTVLDRIDFNVEQACVKTEDGLKQLQKVNPNGSCVHVCLQIRFKESLHFIHFQNELQEFCPKHLLSNVTQML